MATCSIDSRLRVSALGPLRVFVDGAEIDLGPPKQRAVFAVLALCAGETVSREQLVDRVWGESVPSTAAGSLHTYLSGLRRALGPAQDRLVSTRGGYSLLLQPQMFDVTHAEDLGARARENGTLEAYENALTPWTTETILPGIPGPFAAQARDRLTGLRLHMLIGHAERARSDMLPEVIGRLLAEVPAHPFDERLRGVLMKALHRTGRTAEAVAQFEELRRALASELGISPSPASQEIYATILADDRPSARPRAHGDLRPAQLPHDNDAFVGRAAELLILLRSAARETAPRRRIVMISGVGGIGKTTLAVRGGHMLRDSHPDGQVYINLRGFDPSYAALTPEAALHQLLTSAGVRHVPSGREQRAALWRSVLADKRMLLIFDNAASTDQVEDLLPGGDTCFVIVTSRNRLSGLAIRHAARRIPLGALSDEESLTLLTSLIGADRVRIESPSARRLTALCDRSPLALQIAAEQVVSTTGVGIADLVTELEDVQHRLDTLQMSDDPLFSVRGVLSWSFAALDDDAAAAFRRLGIFPGPSLTRRTAAALFGVDMQRAATLLDTLCALCLMERDGDRFTLHDLVRAYAAELSGELPPGERAEALARVLSWYRVSLSTIADRPVGRSMGIEPPQSDVPPVLFHSQSDFVRWCGIEWQNITALIRRASRNGQYGPAWHLTFVLFDYFYTTGRPVEWLELLQVAMRAAEAAGHRVGRAILFNHSSVAHSRLGNNDTAVFHLRRGLELLVEPGDWQHRISLLGNLASTLREAKRYDAARPPAREALELASREGVDYYLAATYDVLCELEAETGRWDEALRQGLPGLMHARRSQSQIIETNLLINVGLARFGLGRHAEAEMTFGEALRISAEAGDRYHEGLALFGLARMGAGNAVVAAGLARRALARFEELDAEDAADVRAFLAGLPS
ncbi:AfsR/SARP family transcriptional regulator [Mangrovihabitans endophyticus]|uniref:XRE family transcriptional regulator n=1 Tax=Mangrovihabitans endophyticus TaxID=1751298 RepID=A0A8J3C216_9ACTN|nr:BTAD domain-containing putative transcriptional regulator [Mangrovihabitans endophyticus]GGK95905.1 XRE family transcriptional regulator [Mangrovihabitans endophyticus]